MEKRTILTASKRGLLEDSFPFRLFQKEKKQLSVRMDILSRARGKKIAEIYTVSDTEMGVL